MAPRNISLQPCGAQLQRRVLLERRSSLEAARYRACASRLEAARYRACASRLEAARYRACASRLEAARYRACASRPARQLPLSCRATPPQLRRGACGFERRLMRAAAKKSRLTILAILAVAVSTLGLP